MSNTATPKQQAFIKRLVAERFNTLNGAGKFDTVHDMLRTMDVENITKNDAKTIITRLMGTDPDPDPGAPTVEGAQRMSKGNKFANPCFTCGHVVPEGDGYYFVRNNTWHTIHGKGDCDSSPVVGVDLATVPAGLYAVPDGDTRLKVRIDKPTSGRWEGHTFVKDGAVYGRGGMLGRCTPGSQYVGKAMDAIQAIAADPKGAAAEYGRLTGSCGLCGRKLEDADSVAAGIGPVCATKF